MTGPNTNDQGQQGTGSSSEQNGAAGSSDVSSQTAPQGSSSSSAGQQQQQTTTTRTTRTDRSSVSHGVKRATGEKGHDSPSDGVSRADGGAQERDDAVRRNR